MRREKKFCAARARSLIRLVVEAYLKIPNELWQELRSEISGQNQRYSTFDIPQPLAPPPLS